MKKPISPVLIRLFCLLLFIAIGSAAYVLTPNKVQTPTPPSNLSPINIVQPTQALLPNSTIKENSASQLATTTSKEAKPELLSATLKASDRTYNLNLQPNTTLLEAMRQLTAQSAQPFIFSGKEYPSLGFFVEEINGIKNDPGSGKYWIYYINGQTAQIGISNYQVKQNDLIEWKYETSKF